MFQHLGSFISRTWWLWLLLWAGLMAGLWLTAPPWDDVAQDGTFAFLPKDAPSRQGERLLKRSFPQAQSESSLVLVLSRSEGVTQADREFIRQTLIPKLKNLADQFAGSSPQDGQSDAQNGPSNQPSEIVEIRSPLDPFVGPLLVSEDEKAMLVVVELGTEFLTEKSRNIVAQVERLTDRLRESAAVPPGLTLHLTGSAVFGRDLIEAREQSA